GSLPETPDCVKADPNHEPDPWSWAPEDETALRVARMPSRLKQYYRKGNVKGCLKVLAEGVLGTLDPAELEPGRQARAVPAVEARLREVLGQRVLARGVVGARLQTWLGRVADAAVRMQRDTPLNDDDIAFIRYGPSDPLELVKALIDHKQPRWLMGWRDITNATNERTVVASVFPRVGVGHTLPIMFPAEVDGLFPVLVAQLSSLTLDYVSRQKLAGTHLTYFYLQQLPVLTPKAFGKADIAYIKNRVLELTYTSYSMRPWAEALGYTGEPFAFDPDRRAQLRADLDAFFAQKYGVCRDELRYILDPADTHGSAYPSETFRGLKRNEMERYGEYRTGQLVLAAWDRLEAGGEFGELGL
ncbi:MAG: type II DNA modification enzyme, partial [Alphaproteobacteria bacterium]|nr:type II DNA modification enzyme [Alphaproteobacteria bacterium]